MKNLIPCIKTAPKFSKTPSKMFGSPVLLNLVHLATKTGFGHFWSEKRKKTRPLSSESGSEEVGGLRKDFCLSSLTSWGIFGCLCGCQLVFVVDVSTFKQGFIAYFGGCQ